MAMLSDTNRPNSDDAQHPIGDTLQLENPVFDSEVQPAQDRSQDGVINGVPFKLFPEVQFFGGLPVALHRCVMITVLVHGLNDAAMLPFVYGAIARYQRQDGTSSMIIIFGCLVLVPGNFFLLYVLPSLRKPRPRHWHPSE